MLFFTHVCIGIIHLVQYENLVLLLSCFNFSWKLERIDLKVEIYLISYNNLKTIFCRSKSFAFRQQINCKYTC
jgi:hypothetical protein